MKLDSGHLSYCTNIHSGENWSDHFLALKNHFPGIKEQVSPDQAMGIGLRLSNTASIDLLNPGELDKFKAWLNENEAYVFTMNGFPYGDFHHAFVKDQVHAPDWTSSERVDYTLRLFKILAGLLPKGMEGGISTSPLSYRFWFPSDEQLQSVMLESTKNIIEVAVELIRINRGGGVKMHLDIEPEPDGILESGAEFIDWYDKILLPLAKKILPQRLQITEEESGNLIKEYICLCYDVCHFAIGYEAHTDILTELSKRNIRVGKIQISAALKAELPDESLEREAIFKLFSDYNEPTYLHQVVAKNTDNQLVRYRDLPDAISDYENLSITEWRAHFHVPVFIKDLGILQSTQSDILEILKVQKENPFTEHMEVETYTWEVLPESLKVPIDQSIIRELNWVKEIMR